MGLTKTLSHNPLTGVTETFVAKDDGTFDIVTTQVIDGIAKDAHQVHKEFRGPGGGSWKGDGFHKVAMVPMTVLTEWMTRGLLQDQNTIKKWVNDPANAIYRTRPGRI